MIDPKEKISITEQCELLALPRSSFYYKRIAVSSSELEMMLEIDKIHLELPFYGSRKIMLELRKRGFSASRNKVRRLMRRMGIEALYRKPRTSIPQLGDHIYPYLLKDLKIEHSNQAWATDITYIPMARGFAYLVAIIDLYSRKILSWKLSNTMDASFCRDALDEAIRLYGTPKIFNSDQGSQFTSGTMIGALKENNIQISMDGKRRWIDNVFIERFWRSIKYEEVYLKAYNNLSEARQNLKAYVEFYNQRRFHQSLDNWTPDEVYFRKTQGKLAA